MQIRRSNLAESPVSEPAEFSDILLVQTDTDPKLPCVYSDHYCNRLWRVPPVTNNSLNFDKTLNYNRHSGQGQKNSGWWSVVHMSEAVGCLVWSVVVRPQGWRCPSTILHDGSH